jgi:CYTH domain-containing protein
MKYARLETERRFLVSSVPDGVTSVSDIVDLYLTDTRLRLREMTTAGQVIRKLGQKARLDEGTRRIAHTTIYLDDAEWEALSALPARRLHKVRHRFERDGVSFAIDEHDDGTLIAEFDGGDVSPADPPTWLDVIREVTDDERFTGGALAP